MFYYGPFTMPGYPTVKGEGMWSKETEVELLRFLPTSVVGMVLRIQEEYGVKVILPMRVPLPDGVVQVDGYEIPPAAVIETQDAGILMSLSLVGLQRAKAMFEQMLGKGSRDVVLNLEAIIVHEETHIKQVLSGRLKELPTQEMVWEGTLWTKKMLEDVGYIDHPWEVEAMKAQIKHVVGDNPTMIDFIFQMNRDEYLRVTGKK